jgi:hypothetical protein
MDTLPVATCVFETLDRDSKLESVTLRKSCAPLDLYEEFGGTKDPDGSLISHDDLADQRRESGSPAYSDPGLHSERQQPVPKAPPSKASIQRIGEHRVLIPHFDPKLSKGNAASSLKDPEKR